MPTIGVASAFFGRVSSSNFNSVVATNAVAPSVTYTSAALSEKVRASSRIYHGFLRVVPVFGPELPLMVGDYLCTCLSTDRFRINYHFFLVMN